LRVGKTSDLDYLFKAYRRLQPRTIHATANLYRQLEREENIYDPANIQACMATWDVDNRLEGWRATVEAVKEILRCLETYGVSESVAVKFSGRGAHVHIHPSAFSPELRAKVNPLDLAYATVEYVRVKVHPKVEEAALRLGSAGLRVDNEMDLQRLFVCPLSLHRELDKVAVFIDPEKLEDFSPEEACVESFKHYEGWRSYRVGEADPLALRAYRLLGGCPSVSRPRRRKHPSLSRQILSWIGKAEELG
jgi:hypothetical protein